MPVRKSGQINGMKHQQKKHLTNFKSSSHISKNSKDVKNYANKNWCSSYTTNNHKITINNSTQIVLWRIVPSNHVTAQHSFRLDALATKRTGHCVLFLMNIAYVTSQGKTVRERFLANTARMRFTFWVPFIVLIRAIGNLKMKPKQPVNHCNLMTSIILLFNQCVPQRSQCPWQHFHKPATSLLSQTH